MAILSEGTTIGTKHLEIANLWVRETDPTNTNYILTGVVKGANPGEGSKFVETGVYSHGCILVRVDGTTGRNANYENVGTVASPSWKVWKTS